MSDFVSRIRNHEFVKGLHQEIIPIIKKRRQAGVTGYRPSELERYSESVFMLVMRIMECFEILKHVRVYLSYFRTNRRYQGAGIDRYKYINYHYYIYAISVVKLMDVVVFLTNDTFRLGNPEKLCNLELIKRNAWVRSAGVHNLLVSLESHVKPWREPRNFFVHRGNTLDTESMIMLGGMELLIREDSSLITTFHPHIKRQYKSEISRIFKKFDKAEQPLFDATSNLLSSLFSVYSSWRSGLEHKEA